MARNLRTTLTLEPDVAAVVREAMRREHKTLKQLVNEALRDSLSPEGSRSSRTPYRVTPFHGRLLGHDPSGFNRLADELEDSAILTRTRSAG